YPTPGRPESGTFDPWEFRWGTRPGVPIGIVKGHFLEVPQGHPFRSRAPGPIETVKLPPVGTVEMVLLPSTPASTDVVPDPLVAMGPRSSAGTETMVGASPARPAAVSVKAPVAES